MSKRYLLALDSTTKEQNNAFLAFVKNSGLGWWHWFENFWLLADPQDKFSAVAIRDKAHQCYPGVHKLVLELHETGDTWAGFGPKTSKRDMFRWLRNTWNRCR